jgi:uncharacterized protein YjbI with pentapeptide repeats
MEVLTAYVRENARRVEPSEGDFASEKGDEVERRVPTDIQAILTVLDRRDSTHERPEQRLDLQDTDLPGVDLSGANLAGANLFGTNLEEANLLGADLTKAYLESANLSGASLIGAYLTRANLWGANLEVASL